MIRSAGSLEVAWLTAETFSVQPSIVLQRSIETFGSETIDLSSRLTALSVSNSLNDATGSAVFTFSRGSGSDSLSPLVAASALRYGDGRPVLDPNVGVFLYMQVRDSAGADIGAPIPVFTGRVDAVNVAASPTTITVQCRDMGARYLNRLIGEARQYSTPAGQQVEVVMGDILLDNGFLGLGSDIYVPVTSGYIVTDFFTGEISVLESLRILAQQIGWDVRWFERATGFEGTPGLRFYDPGRERVDTDMVLDATRYAAVTALSFSDADVRNSWDVFYPDCVTPAHVEDATSIARYGLRYARIGEDRALNIRTAPAAQTLADSALADTKDPFTSHEIRMPIFPVVQLNDLHRYQGNADEYDADLSLAVVGYRHDWKVNKTAQERNQPTTTISARGTPIAAYRDYRKSVEPRVIASTIAPDPARYAPEGTVWLKYTPA